MTPPVPIVSSSGWAWTVINVSRCGSDGSGSGFAGGFALRGSPEPELVDAIGEVGSSVMGG